MDELAGGIVSFGDNATLYLGAISDRLHVITHGDGRGVCLSGKRAERA